MRKVIPFLLSFCLCVGLCACSSQKDYPTKYKDSQAKTISDVLDTSFPKTDVISDGSIALVDTTNASQGYIGCQLLSDPGSKVKLIVEKDDKNIPMILIRPKWLAFLYRVDQGIIPFG